jgi:hypothetical protein
MIGRSDDLVSDQTNAKPSLNDAMNQWTDQFMIGWPDEPMNC